MSEYVEYPCCATFSKEFGGNPLKRIICGHVWTNLGKLESNFGNLLSAYKGLDRAPRMFRTLGTSKSKNKVTYEMNLYKCKYCGRYWLLITIKKKVRME